MADVEEQLAQFMTITGAETGTALQFLQLTNYQLDEAVNLFMESGGDGGGGGASASAAAAHAQHFDDDVRAPDSSVRQRLVGEEGFQLPMRRLQDQNRDFVAESIAAINALARGDQISSAFGQQAANSAFGAAAMAEGASERTRDLSALFQPPVGLIFQGTYAEARAAAKRESKWLLVNIQDEIVFASHMLNRDTWSDDVVQNVVQSGYIFWQHYWVSELGKKFCTLYQVDRDTLPLVAIIDPKSGEMIQSWHGFMTSELLTEKLSDFCFTHPADFADRSAVEAQPDLVDASEDDQLAAAIAASMDDDGRASANMSVESDDESKEEEDGVDSEDEQAVVEVLPPEPAEGTTDVTRVQIRAPDGTRLTRRFLKTDPISMLWTFVKEQIPESRTRAFELRTTFPPSAVSFSDEQSLADCQLENAALMVKWL